MSSGDMNHSDSTNSARSRHRSRHRRRYAPWMENPRSLGNALLNGHFDRRRDSYLGFDPSSSIGDSINSGLGSRQPRLPWHPILPLLTNVARATAAGYPGPPSSDDEYNEEDEDAALEGLPSSSSGGHHHLEGGLHPSRHRSRRRRSSMPFPHQQHGYRGPGLNSEGHISLSLPPGYWAEKRRLGLPTFGSLRRSHGDDDDSDTDFGGSIWCSDDDYDDNGDGDGDGDDDDLGSGLLGGSGGGRRRGVGFG